MGNFYLTLILSPWAMPLLLETATNQMFPFEKKEKSGNFSSDTEVNFMSAALLP